MLAEGPQGRLWFFPQADTLAGHEKRLALAGTALGLVADVRHGNAGIAAGLASNADFTGGAVLRTTGALGDILKPRRLGVRCRPRVSGRPALDLLDLAPTTAAHARQEDSHQHAH